MTPMELGNVTFDAADPPRLAAFWSAALGQPIAQAEPHFALLARNAQGIQYLFIKVPEGKTAKNRMHVDFHTDDLEAEVARLVALGATEQAAHHEQGVVWRVLADPEGNEFCVGREE
jgi:predicted enzyme related to lactoylglutathione lyase